MQPESLQETITILAERVGKRLLSAEYRCFAQESSEVAQPLFAMGGEVCLRFESTAPMYLAWFHDRTAEWEAHYVISAFAKPTFREDAIEVVDVSDTTLWKPLVNTERQSVHIASWTVSPAILRFTFGGGVAYVCSGIQWDLPGGIGDGDWVLVRSESEFRTYHGRYLPFCLLVSIPDQWEVGL